MLAVAVCTIAESLQHHFASVLVRVTFLALSVSGKARLASEANETQQHLF